MRLTRTLFLLLTALTGCGSVSIVLKSPVESKCGSAGLQGCPDLSRGVLLYLEGQEVEGKDLLIKGSAANSPENVRKFAKMIKDLKKIPGASKYAQPLIEVADILTSAPSGAQGGAGAGAGNAPAGTPNQAPPAGPGEGGTVVLAQAPNRAPCGGVGAGLGYCVIVAAGPLVLTDLTTGPGCPGEVVAASARPGGSADIPRWVARNPRGAADQRATVLTGELLVVGVQSSAANDPRCTLRWAGFRPNR